MTTQQQDIDERIKDLQESIASSYTPPPPQQETDNDKI